MRRIEVPRAPRFIFRKEGRFLVGEDKELGLIAQYYHSVVGTKAFGGRSVKFEMEDGSVLESDGYWFYNHKIGEEVEFELDGRLYFGNLKS